MGICLIDDGQESGQKPIMGLAPDWRKRLDAEIKAQGREYKELSQEAELGETYVRDAIKRGRGKLENLQVVLGLLGKPADWLDEKKRPLIASYDPDQEQPDLSLERPVEDAESEEAAQRASRQQLRPGELVERDARGGLGTGSYASVTTVDGHTVDYVRATWRVPVEFLHTELRAREADVDIIPVDGDSMIPTLLPGDRVLIHRAATAPSPDGLFAIDDGIGMSVKRLQLVRGSDPLQVRIISDNALHAPDVIAASDLKVIGRVICKVTRL